MLDLVSPRVIDRVSQPLMVRRCLFFTVGPWLVLSALRLLARARLALRDDALVLAAGGASYTIPRASLAAVVPWRVPLPGAGVTLRLASGRAFRLGLIPAAPAAFFAALAPGAPRAEAVALARTRWLRHPLLKFGLLGLVPTLLLFRVQQLIAGGELLAEYHAYGLAKYLDSLLLVWLIVLSHLLVVAAGLRVVTEAVALPAARLWPRAASPVRWIMEVAGAAGFVAAIALGLMKLFMG